MEDRKQALGRAFEAGDDAGLLRLARGGTARVLRYLSSQVEPLRSDRDAFRPDPPPKERLVLSPRNRTARTGY